MPKWFFPAKKFLILIWNKIIFYFLPPKENIFLYILDFYVLHNTSYCKTFFLDLYFFLFSTSLCFSSSERFLYCSRPCSCFSSFERFFVPYSIDNLTLIKLPQENWMLGQPLFFSCCLRNQFFIHLCDLWDAMPHHWSPLSFPTQPIPREAEDFPMGDKYPKHVHLPTYFGYM